MTPSAAPPTPARNANVDVLRTFALMGICVVNLPLMALPESRLWQPVSPGADAVAAWLVGALFQGKFYLIFAFLFGWSLHAQIGSAMQAGQQLPHQGAALGASLAKRRHLRRTAGLVAFGLAHALLIYSGDILITYAIVGLLLWRLRARSDAALLRHAGIWFGVGVLMWLLIGWSVQATHDISAHSADADDGSVLLGGSYLQTVHARAAQWLWVFPSMLALQGPVSLAAALCGLLAARHGVLQPGHPQQARWGRRWPGLLATALPLNALQGLAALNTPGVWGEWGAWLPVVGYGLSPIGDAALALLYMLGVSKLVQRWPPPRLLLQAGRNSLSAYLLQGVLAGLMLGGYGLGLFGHLSAAQLLPLAIALAACASLLVAWYAQHMGHGRGPFEPLLRAITHSGDAAVLAQAPHR